MTIKECIDIVDNIKPNQYGTREKVQWLSFIDGIIINDVLKTHEGYDGRYDEFTGYTEDKISVALIVPSPYDRLYTAYLKMQIDKENGETTRYNNSASEFNSYLMEYRKYYNKTHMPLSNADKKPIPKKTSVGISDAEFENLKRELYALLSEDFAEMTSDDKIYSIVTDYMNTNAQMLKGKDGIDGVNGKDGYTPVKGKDYFDGEKGAAFTYDDFTPAQLDSLKGEKGDKGDKGDQGVRGLQGVQGEKGDKGEDGKDAVIDQTYSSTSKNAQSGVAVSQALKTLKTSNGTVVSQNADFAEVAEWADGNPNNEDRTGYFVCANVPLNGIVMKKATSLDDVKGVSILAPAFAGNYTKDKLDSEGNLLPKYSYVAILGFVPVIDNGTCTVGGRCMPDDNGCAVPSSNSMGYQVVNRIDANRVLIIIEPNGDMVQRVKTKINKLEEDVNNLAPDQTYNPESENAQSGKAVAEALATLGGQYELIEAITVSDEDQKAISRNIEPNGNAYSIKDVFISIDWENTMDTTTSLSFDIAADGKKYNAFISVPKVNNTSTGTYIRTLRIYNHITTFFYYTTSNVGQANTPSMPMRYLETDKPIDEIKLTTNDKNFPVGAQINIWGVRA